MDLRPYQKEAVEAILSARRQVREKIARAMQSEDVVAIERGADRAPRTATRARSSASPRRSPAAASAARDP